MVSLGRAMERISAVVGRGRPSRRKRPFGFLSRRRYERLNDLKGHHKASFARENPKGLAGQLGDMDGRDDMTDLLEWLGLNVRSVVINMEHTPFGRCLAQGLADVLGGPC